MKQQKHRFSVPVWYKAGQGMYQMDLERRIKAKQKRKERLEVLGHGFVFILCVLFLLFLTLFR